MSPSFNDEALMSSGVISYPVPAYANVPIEPQFYQPNRFVISNITRGKETLVTTSVDHNYVIGQQIRLLIPNRFGSYQLNEISGYVLSVPSPTTVLVDINSTNADAFIASPYTATITNITNALSATVTANNSFGLGSVVIFSDVSGMTQINGLLGTISTVTSTTFLININTSTFSAYTSGGTATLFNVPQTQAQILAIGDINLGATNASGSQSTQTYINGSFINISPQ